MDYRSCGEILLCLIRRSGAWSEPLSHTSTTKESEYLDCESSVVLKFSTVNQEVSLSCDKDSASQQSARSIIHSKIYSLLNNLNYWFPEFTCCSATSATFPS